MQQDSKQNGQSSEDPAEGREDVPSPERGSPQPSPRKLDHGAVEERIEKGEWDDGNPLAPPVNTQAGS